MEPLFEDYTNENEDDLGTQKYQDYNEAYLWNTDWTTETLITQINKNNIDLNPDFQRRNAWSNIQKSKLIESLILGIPVPPIILAEQKKDKKTVYLVIDGKQRLLAIKQFFSTNIEKDKYEPLVLTGLEILKELNGKDYNQINQDAILSDYLNKIENQPIRTVIIRGWKQENFLYTIFLRLNTGSLKLSPQELRQALHPGEFLKYINDYTLAEDNIMQKLLKLSQPDRRMRDVELLLRYFSFKNFKDEYNGNLKQFLDDACEKLNKLWQTNKKIIIEQMNELENAFSFIKEIFGEEYMFKVYSDDGYQKLMNRTIFDLFTIYFSEKNNRDLLQDKKEEIKNSFEQLMKNDIKFKEYTASSTKNKQRTEYRFTKFNESMEALKND